MTTTPKSNRSPSPLCSKSMGLIVGESCFRLPKLQRTKSKAIVASVLNTAIDLVDKLANDLKTRKIDAMTLLHKRKAVLEGKLELYGPSEFLQNQLNDVQGNIKNILHQFVVKKRLLEGFTNKCFSTLNCILTPEYATDELDSKIEAINLERDNLIAMIEKMDRERQRVINRIADLEELEDQIRELESVMMGIHDQFLDKIKAISQRMITVASSGKYTELNLALTLRKMNEETEVLRNELFKELDRKDEEKTDLIKEASRIKSEIDEEINDQQKEDFKYLKSHIARPLVEALVQINRIRPYHADPLLYLRNWLCDYHEKQKQMSVLKKERAELREERRQYKLNEFSRQLKLQLWQLVEDEINKENSAEEDYRLSMINIPNVAPE